MMIVHRRLPRCVLAVGLTALYVLGLASSLLHRVEIAHVPCADHGEWVHARGAAAEVAVVKPAPNPGASGQGIADGAGGTADDDGRHEHEHCLLAAFAFLAIAHEDDFFATPPWPSVRATRILAIAPPLSSYVETARYLLAPKGSPPHRA
jgi:hypothetical protein